MKEISNHFCLIPKDAVSSKMMTGDNIYYERHKMPRFACKNKITFTEEPSSSDEGILYSQSFKAVVADLAILDYNRSRDYYIGIFDADGGLIVIGSPDSTPTILVRAYEKGLYQVSADFTTVDPLM